MERKICNKEIAILMATYNGEKYIEEQIMSIINQTFIDWKLYIHDDGSKDKTVEIIEKYMKRYPEQIEIIYSESTGGARNNFLFLMASVEAKYYMCCDQDDVWCKDKIEKTYNEIIRLETDSSTPVLVFTDLEVVDKNMKTISGSMNKYQKLNAEKTNLYRLLIHNCVTGCTMMFNYKLCSIALLYKDIANIIMHDWWIAICAAYFGEFSYLPVATIKYRQHDDNSVGAIDSASLDYYKQKLKNVNSIKESIESTRRQVKEFSRTYGLVEDNILSQYGRLSSKRKISRVVFHLKHKIIKSGVARNIGLLIWG